MNQRLGSKSKGEMVLRYIVVTELNFMLLDPVPDKGNKGKLLFFEDVRKTSQSVDFEDNYIVFKWKKNNNIYLEFTLDCISCENYELYDWLVKRNEKLVKSFKIFQEDSYKLSEDLSSKINTLSMEELRKRIEYNETLRKKNENNKIVNQDLLTLYQKAVELLSSEDNEEFHEYLGKLQDLIKITHEVQEENFSKAIFERTSTDPDTE